LNSNSLVQINFSENLKPAELNEQPLDEGA